MNMDDITYHNFRFEPTPDLLETLNQHPSIGLALKILDLELNEILRDSSLWVPSEYIPGVGWGICTSHNIKPEYQDFLEMILKFAWYYTAEPFSPLRPFVDQELIKFELGTKLQLIHQQRVEASQKERSWKALDKWIAYKLKNKKIWTNRQLWEAVPQSYDNKKIYKEGDKIFCTKNSRKPITFRAFCDHVRKIKKKIKYE